MAAGIVRESGSPFVSSRVRLDTERAWCRPDTAALSGRRHMTYRRIALLDRDRADPGAGSWSGASPRTCRPRAGRSTGSCWSDRMRQGLPLARSGAQYATAGATRSASIGRLVISGRRDAPLSLWPVGPTTTDSRKPPRRSHFAGVIPECVRGKSELRRCRTQRRESEKAKNRNKRFRWAVSGLHPWCDSEFTTSSEVSCFLAFSFFRFPALVHVMPE